GAPEVAEARPPWRARCPRRGNRARAALMGPQKRSERDFQRHVALQFGRGLLYGRDVGEREFARVPARRPPPGEAPLLPIAGMVLANARIQMSNVFDAD